MWDAGMLHPRHFFFPRTFFLQRCKVTGELTAEEMLSAWGSAEVNDTFSQALFYENIKCAWERADVKNFLSGTFYGHFESALDSADKKNFFVMQFF